MDVSEFRRQAEAESEQAAQEEKSFREVLEGSRPKRRSGNRGLAAPTPAADQDDLAAALTVVRNPRASETLRAAALHAIGAGVTERPDLIDGLLDVLRDQSVPTDQRLGVLNLLQQISFQMVGFPGKRPAYLEALRSIVDDPDAELRRRAIGILAREKDEYVQRRLVEGLQGTAKALVPAAKAIQFLGYDVHAEYYPMLRRIVEKPPNQAAKKEAMQLLAADPSSEDLMVRILKDKSEKSDVRRVSAVALQSMAPARLAVEARRMVVDDSEDDDLRAVLLNTLTYFGNGADLAGDAELNRHVEGLTAGSTSKQLKQAGAAYMSKHPT
jgi:hypothetical protein